MKFKNVKQGMFFYHRLREYLLYVLEESNNNIKVVLYDDSNLSVKNKISFGTLNSRTWEDTIWVDTKKATSTKQYSQLIIIGMFTDKEIKYEV